MIYLKKLTFVAALISISSVAQAGSLGQSVGKPNIPGCAAYEQVATTNGTSMGHDLNGQKLKPIKAGTPIWRCKQYLK